MAMDTKSKSVPLNRVTHGLRVSQLIYQYGPGGMVDFPDQTLMTAAPEYWAEQVERIHDERLERALKVDYFGMPSAEAGKQMGISYVRFPEWYFCPKCRSFQPIGEWVKAYQKSNRAKEKDKDMVKNIRCPKCWQPLVVSRIVTVCENGHIDDFPWVEWVHARSYAGREVCSNPQLRMMTASSSSEGLEGISVVCEYCKAKATLSGAFDKPKLFDNAVKGVPAKVHYCDDDVVVMSELDSILNQYQSEGFKDVVILTVKTEADSVLSGKMQDGKYRKRFTFSTCRKFKGLEAEVVVLVDVDRSTFDDEHVLLFYVGTSRARTRLEILTQMTDEDCRTVLQERLNQEGYVKAPRRKLASALNASASIRKVQMQGE